MADTPITFNKRTFSEINDSTINLIREKYPEVIRDFTDSSVGAVLIELNSGIANNLAVNTDRAFVETQLEYAQQRNSLLNIAKNIPSRLARKSLGF